MNIAARELTRAGCETIALAGVRAACDWRGVVHFPDLDLLVVSDLHLEKGSSHARRGRLIPPYDTAATLLRLASVVDDYAPKTIISLGDSFHDGEGAARLPEPFRDSLIGMMKGRDWFWVAGNHDPDAPDDLPGETVQQLAVGGLVFRHEPSKGHAEGEVAGHLHPCARIVQRSRSVRRRCFASDGLRLVMPAFGAFTGSLNVLDHAYKGIFRNGAPTAYMIGTSRVYPIAGSLLRPG
ncbi:ligase-associated DNA damage response endonuclease PdeM [Aminobacter anthyllidis]|uniref:ligase-associated DNA damage response endonuclease PdeM n=1 Tax=Aminobacter anthyllidis TaxID=1035067 RepID=UPI00245622F3|nr:ligase-associated DNA damage response endonuclease PdeM [Aminobacter anthyllidis]MDH4986193.1 ligase-associated DNA damage response endonuclease PdeM [Aminobacter anthyllidis]